jgi:hypothetical protein
MRWRGKEHAKRILFVIPVHKYTPGDVGVWFGRTQKNMVSHRLIWLESVYVAYPVTLFTLRLEVDEGGRSFCVLFVVCHRWRLALNAEISNQKPSTDSVSTGFDSSLFAQLESRTRVLCRIQKIREKWFMRFYRPYDLGLVEFKQSYACDKNRIWLIDTSPKWKW